MWTSARALALGILVVMAPGVGAATAAVLSAGTQLPAETTAATTWHQHPKGFAFETPSDWMVEEQGGNVLILPPDGTFPREVYAINSDVGYSDARDPRIAPQLQVIAETMVSELRRDSATEAAARASSGQAVYAWDGQNPQTGAPVHVQFFVRAANNTLLLLMAVAPPDVFLMRESHLRRIASSFAPGEASSTASNAPSQPAPRPAPERGALTDSSPLANQWAQRLAGKMLTRLSSYSSGSSGGYSSETRLILAPDGTFSGHRSSSVSVYVPGATGGSGGQNRFSGRWYIYQSENGVAVLRFHYEGDAEYEHNQLENRNGQTFINGNRWFVTEPR
jgi:hypothetical protein